jgi:hypothetical protein
MHGVRSSVQEPSSVLVGESKRFGRLSGDHTPKTSVVEQLGNRGRRDRRGLLDQPAPPGHETDDPIG